MAKILRGSQKHLLDLLDHKSYGAQLNKILGGADVQVDRSDVRRPEGKPLSKEWRLPNFCEQFCQGRMAHGALLDWWVPRPWKPPQWDLLSTCRVSGRIGLLLVEAKAHEAELSYGGKRLKPTASDGSKRNHAHIRGRIADASRECNKLGSGAFNLQIDTHYQLANRVAHLWKLASIGVPTVLLYLGFLGDTYFPDYLRDRDHWHRAMDGYINGVLPKAFPGKRIEVAGGGSMLLLIDSLPVLEASPT